MVWWFVLQRESNEASVSDELQFIARASIIVGGPPRALIGQMGRRPEAARRGHQQICPLSCVVGPSIDPRLQSTKVVI